MKKFFLCVPCVNGELQGDPFFIFDTTALGWINGEFLLYKVTLEDNFFSVGEVDFDDYV